MRPVIETYCLNCEKWIADQPDDSFDCVILDPPHNFQYLDGLILECMRVSKGAVALLSPLTFNYEAYPRPPLQVDESIGVPVQALLPLNSPLGFGEAHVRFFGNTDGVTSKNLLASDAIWVDIPTDKQHPGTKPIELGVAILRIMNPMFHSRILDPFMGSGSFAAACVMQQHDFVGIEIDPKWYSYACKRIDRALKGN